MTQTNRPALAKLFRACRQTHGIELEDMATFAAESDYEPGRGIADPLIDLVDPDARSASGQSDWRALKIYGALSEEQRRILQEGGSVAFANVGSRCHHYLAVVTYPGMVNNYDYESEKIARNASPSLEPTEAFAEGLPAGGWLSMRTANHPIIFGYAAPTPNGRSRRNALSIDSVGDYVYALDHPGLGIGNLIGQTPLTLFAMGSQAMHKLRVMYSPQAWNELLMSENKPGTDAPGPWTALPEDVQKRIKAGVKRWEQNMIGSGVKPPPPERG